MGGLTGRLRRGRLRRASRRTAPIGALAGLCLRRAEPEGLDMTLEELQTTIAGIAERVGPSVVGLGRGWGRGSGVVIAPGRVLTNAHNVRRDQVSVVFADGRRESGEW